MEINNDKFRVLNAIVVRKCVEFCMKYWKHRNEAYHDAEKQKLRITQQFLNEKERAENSEMMQLKEYTMKSKIDIDRCSAETMKIWIKNLKIIEKKIQKVPRNDIRRYLNLTTVQNGNRKEWKK